MRKMSQKTSNAGIYIFCHRSPTAAAVPTFWAPRGQSNLLDAIEMLNAARESAGAVLQLEGREIQLSEKTAVFKLVVSGVEIESSGISTMSDARAVLEQVAAGTYVKPNPSPSAEPLAYRGWASFWNREYKHDLRAASTQQRKSIRRAFVKNGLAVDGASAAHEAIVLSHNIQM